MATHRAEITINAAPKAVFEALTKPELVKLWQYDKELITNWQTGSEIKFRAEMGGNVLEQWGTVLDIRKNELVKYNLFTPRPDLEDKPKNYCVTSYILTSSGGKTNVEIIQEDNRPSGFTPITLMPILVSLKKTVENGNPQKP
jgi:uncharacterized protein YndB with AHSA1/START domain